MIIIVSDSLKSKIEYFIKKALNGKFFPEILFLSKETFENTVIENPDVCIIYNSDDKNLQKIFKDKDYRKIDFGFNENAIFKASDANKSDEGTNFKLNFKGNSVPIWFKEKENISIEDEIYNVLPAICIGEYLGLNIVEISENLKN